MAFSEATIVDYTASVVYDIMAWSSFNYWLTWAVVWFFSMLFSLAPWRLPTEHDFLDMTLHTFRRCLFWTGVLLVLSPILLYYFYDLSWRDRMPNHMQLFVNWALGSAKSYAWLIPVAAIGGLLLRLYYFRYFHAALSGWLREWRNLQPTDEESDIRLERLRYNAKDFLPSKFYKKDFKDVFIGLDIKDQPIFIPGPTWLETSMQVIGPTRYGKGVAMGAMMDQVIRRGDGLVYVDPKGDRWAAKVMLQACLETKRPFYYVTLHDNGIGYWSPFEGGLRRDAYSRLVTIFGMIESNGDSDFYKILEKMQLNRIIGQHDRYDLETLYKKIKAHNNQARNDRDKAIKVEGVLENWRQIKSLNPPSPADGFSIEKALLENAVVYVQGSLTDDVVKVATKAFIMEMIQETMRLSSQRSSHVTLIIDEVRFLVSKTLADALATIVGFNAKIITAYQSINDLKAPDDVNLDGEVVLQAVNVNSQCKLIYGGADVETAEWVSELSGTRMKAVTAMEKTNIRTAGAEEWDKGRMVKRVEEALIHPNVVKTLPARVCVLFQPNQLATVAFTSPVKVKDDKQMDNWLAQQPKLHAEAPQEKPKARVVSLPSRDEDEEEARTVPEQTAASEPEPGAKAAPSGPKFVIADLAKLKPNEFSEEQLAWVFGNPKRFGPLKELMDANDFKTIRKRHEELKEKKKAATLIPDPTP